MFDRFVDEQSMNKYYKLFTFRLSFQIYIDGIVGRSYLSDIAIDAIKILNSKSFINNVISLFILGVKPH